MAFRQRISDLEKLPKSYKELNRLTGVEESRLRLMTKSEMKNLQLLPKFRVGPPKTKGMQLAAPMAPGIEVDSTVLEQQKLQEALSKIKQYMRDNDIGALQVFRQFAKAASAAISSEEIQSMIGQVIGAALSISELAHVQRDIGDKVKQPLSFEEFTQMIRRWRGPEVDISGPEISESLDAFASVAVQMKKEIASANSPSAIARRKERLRLKAEKVKAEKVKAEKERKALETAASASTSSPRGESLDDTRGEAAADTPLLQKKSPAEVTAESEAEAQARAQQEKEKLKKEVAKQSRRVAKALSKQLRVTKSKMSQLLKLTSQLKHLNERTGVDIAKLRGDIEATSRNLSSLRKATAQAKDDYERVDKQLNDVRGVKVTLIEHMSMVLFENESRKEQKLRELKCALDATIMQSGNEVTALLKRATEAAKKTPPTEFTVKRTKDIRIGGNKHQVVAWNVEVLNDVDVQFSVEFFRSQSCMTFSVTVPERVTEASGNYMLPEHGVLILKFDNSYSWFKNKKIKLQHATAEPLDGEVTTTAASSSYDETSSAAVAAAATAAENVQRSGTGMTV